MHATALQLKYVMIAMHYGDFTYRKNSKNWDTLNYYRDCPTNGIVGFYSAILCSKDADTITNRVDTEEQSDLGLHCLLRPICPNISNYYGTTLCISKSKEPSETLRDIRILTYQIYRIDENTNQTTKFQK